MELFVTDLDGTLLNNESVVTGYTRDAINGLIDKGVKFTVATGRTPATAVEILDGLKLDYPIVSMNGAIIYDIKNQKYIDVKEMSFELVLKVLDIFEEYDKNILVYGIKDDHLWVYYNQFQGIYEYEFYKERADKTLKTFIKVLDYREAIKGAKIVNFLCFDSVERIKEICSKVRALDGITANYYIDGSKEDCCFLEVHSSEASKANGIKFLASYIEHDKLICFGDNVNDIPMFEIADERYSTENAVDVLKSMSTGVIGHCNEDGVAKYLLNRFK